MNDTSDTARIDASDPQSIVLVNQYYAPADAPTATLLADVGEALAADGHDVRAIASRRGYRDASQKFPKRELRNGVHVRRVAGTGFDQRRRWGRLVNYFAFFASAGRQLLFTRKPDIVVSLSTPPLLATIAQTVAHFRGARFVYWVMDVHPELAFRLGHLKKFSITGRILEWSGRRTLHHADAVIALGDDMARELKPYSNGSTRVVHNWADGERITPKANSENTLRKEWGWDEKFVVAYSGTIGLVHDFDTILDAAAHLEGDDRYLFCFIGGGSRADEVSAEVERRNLTNVEFKDFVSDELLPESLTAPDVHLVSLREDLSGLSVPSKAYSVMAAGRPLAYIGPESSSIADIVTANDCGVHIPNGDGKALAETLKRYGECEQTLDGHGSAAREIFDSSFSRQKGVKAWISTIIA